MSARIDPAAVSIRPMTLASLDGVMDLEVEVYPFPWSRGNFLDSIAAGYTAWTLNRPDGALVAYCVAMAGAGEMHLLNITVGPTARCRGHARHLLEELLRLCVATRAARLWLEVRVSNADARAAYRRLGLVEVGLRKGYYPAPASGREDAIVMNLDVATAWSGHALD